MTELSDELLVAYVDGQLDRPQAATLARLLGEDEELVRRVRRLQQTQARLMDSFATMQRNMECGALEDMLSHSEARTETIAVALGASARWGAVAALVAVGAVGGFGASYYFSSPAQVDRTPKSTARIDPAVPAATPTPTPAQEPHPVAAVAAASPRHGATGAMGGAAVAPAPTAAPTVPLTWTDELASVHVQLMRDASSYSEGPANRDLAPFQLASLAGRALPVPDFTKQGLTLTRSQMLSFKGSRLMQLSYASAGRSESAATLYVLAGSSAGSEPLAFGAAGEVRAAGWSMDGVRYAIAGKLPPDALRALAAVAQSQIGKRA
jgi:anti-sigma factor RsiW